jgi:predicted nucleic acid-binding protein
VTVIDASAALGLVFPDESVDDKRLEDVVRGGPLHAPGNWTFECANALTTAVRRGRIAPAVAVRAAETLVWLQVEIHQESRPSVLVQTALECGLSAYDAAYLDLARRGGWALLTFDRRLIDAAEAMGVELA